MKFQETWDCCKMVELAQKKILESLKDELYIYIYIKGQNGTVARNIFFEVNIYIKEVM